MSDARRYLENAVPSVLLLALAAFVLGLRAALLLTPAAAILPLVIVSFRSQGGRDPAEDLRREGPEIVAMMSVPLHNGEPLEEAVRFIARSEGLRSAVFFHVLLWEVDNRRHGSVKKALDSVDAFTDGSPLALAMQLLIASSDSCGAERDGLIDEANKVAIDGMRSSLESYAASLNVPAMTVFAAGIILPLICVSLLPLMQMGSALGAGGPGFGPLAAAGLLLLPALVALYMRQVLQRNPLPRSDGGGGAAVAAVLCVIPITVIAHQMNGDPFIALALGCVPLCIVLRMRLKRGQDEMKLLKEGDEELVSNLVRLGNGLRSGKALEASIESAMPRHGRGRSALHGLLHRLQTSRAEPCDAVNIAFKGLSATTASVYRSVFQAARKDLAQTGNLCIRMGRHLQQRRISRDDVMNRMRSLNDMMSGTSTVFAPMVLGIGLSLAAPMEGLGENVDPWTVTLTGLYLVELAVLTSWIGSRLSGEADLAPVAYAGALRIPMALTVFYLSWRMLSGGFIGL